MAVFVLPTAVLYQRGSSESKRVGVTETVDVDPRDVTAVGPPWPVKRGGAVLRLYEHSLGLALVALFLVSIVGHALAGVAHHNQEQISHGAPTASLAQFVPAGSSGFNHSRTGKASFCPSWRWSC
jgi:hypothetical protein